MNGPLVCLCHDLFCKSLPQPISHLPSHLLTHTHSPGYVLNSMTYYHRAVSSHHIAHIYSMKALGLLTFSLIWRFGLSILHFWKVLDLKRTGQEGNSIKNFEYLFQRLTSTLKLVCTLPYVRLVASSTKFGRYAGIHEVQAICYAPKDYPSLWYIGHVNITSLSLSAYSRLANYGTSLFLYAASSSVAWHLWQCWPNFARTSHESLIEGKERL